VGDEPLLTRDDLDELSDAADEAADPADVAAELIRAVEGGRLADRADEGYAYLLAAEIYERTDGLARALAQAERALLASRTAGDRGTGSIRAFRAELLLRLGREQEALAELTALRPLMTTDALAASYVPEALAAGGRPDLAGKWLAEALAERAGADPADPVRGQLTATRDRLAESPGDEFPDGAGEDYPDEYAPDGRDGGDDAGASYDGAEALLLVWPLPEYERVDERWPEVLEATGADGWDDYRRRQQAVIAAWSQRHRAPLWQVTGTADGFEEFLSAREVDLASADLVGLAQRYGDYLAEQADPQPLPPAPADPCWCRSGLAYQSCCLRLASR
jgi:hypothetical protein